MSDQQPATKADLAVLRGEVFAIRDEFGTLRDEYGRRIVELERGQSELRDIRRLVTQLHERIRENTGQVATVMEMLNRQDVNTAQVIRQSMSEMRDQFTAAVRMEMVGVRDEVKELRGAVEARPCLAGHAAECPIPGVEGTNA